MITMPTSKSIVEMVQKILPNRLNSSVEENAFFCQKLLGETFHYVYWGGCFNKDQIELITLFLGSGLSEFAFMLENLLQKMILHRVYITMTCRIFRSGLQYLLEIAELSGLKGRAGGRLWCIILHFDSYLLTHKIIKGNEYGWSVDLDKIPVNHLWWF